MSRKMVRKQLYIQAAQADLLKEKAKSYNVSEGELVRAALDKYLLAPAANYTGIDMDAWKEELEFISGRMAKTAAEKPEAAREERKWKREDLYEC